MSTVKVTLTAQDLISPQLAQIQQRIENLGASARISVSRSFLNSASQTDLNSLRAGITQVHGQVQQTDNTWSSFVGNLAASGTMMAIGAVINGFSQIQSTIMSAAQTETLALAQSGDVATRLGISFSKAKGLVSDLRGEISQIAADLPGENAGFNNIYQQISGSVAKVARGDVNTFKADVTELTKRYGVLAAIRGADASMSGSALNRAIAGTSGLGELVVCQAKNCEFERE